MGQSCSRPLQKVQNGPTNNRVTGGNPSSFHKPELIQNDIPPIVRTYFSFPTFFKDNKDPTIYEWLFLKEIGQGQMSNVYLTKNLETGEVCAAKVYNNNQLLKQTKSDDDPPYEGVRREIKIMSTVPHRYILSIIEVIEDDLTNSLILMIPYAARGTLQNLIDTKNFTPKSLSYCFFQVAEGFRFLHSCNIVHRDLCPASILCFSETYFIIANFSLSINFESNTSVLTDAKGRDGYMAPEIIENVPYDAKLADVWSYGATLFSALLGRTIQKDDIDHDFEILNTLNFEGVDLLKKILTVNPEERPTFEDIVLDPWFTEPREDDQKAQIEEAEDIMANQVNQKDNDPENEDGNNSIH